MQKAISIRQSLWRLKDPSSVIFDLQKKGISDKVIQTVLEGYTLREQLENAIQIAQSYLKGKTRHTKSG